MLWLLKPQMNVPLIDPVHFMQCKVQDRGCGGAQHPVEAGLGAHQAQAGDKS